MEHIPEQFWGLEKDHICMIGRFFSPFQNYEFSHLANYLCDVGSNQMS
mgnify:CR=1 FL=1